MEEKINTEKCVNLTACIDWIVEHHGGEEHFLAWLQDNEDDALIWAHHGFGTWIRNTLELWYDGPPVKYFNDIGIYHADDMSGIIITSAHRKLNNKEINLDEQVKKYRDHWEEHNPDINKGIK